jgi:hypothetical protein
VTLGLGREEDTMTKSKEIKIYRDRDDNGFCFTVYVDGKCHGCFLADDESLERLGGVDWRSKVIDGLDNRG